MPLYPRQWLASTRLNESPSEKEGKFRATRTPTGAQLSTPQ